ncbi:hypothetical protein AB0K09_11470 [Streptomyces sp. NPDC049577]|uniref:hypothetical protein n=1 Tax=Streptomyces sp. NPDC049577 TaxID=3155153 RepID=UPI00343BA9B6
MRALVGLAEKGLGVGKGSQNDCLNPVRQPPQVPGGCIGEADAVAGLPGLGCDVAPALKGVGADDRVVQFLCVEEDNNRKIEKAMGWDQEPGT